MGKGKEAPEARGGPGVVWERVGREERGRGGRRERKEEK